MKPMRRFAIGDKVRIVRSHGAVLPQPWRVCEIQHLFAADAMYDYTVTWPGGYTWVADEWVIPDTIVIQEDLDVTDLVTYGVV